MDKQEFVHRYSLSLKILSGAGTFARIKIELKKLDSIYLVQAFVGECLEDYVRESGTLRKLAEVFSVKVEVICEKLEREFWPSAEEITPQFLSDLTEIFGEPKTYFSPFTQEFIPKSRRHLPLMLR